MKFGFFMFSVFSIQLTKLSSFTIQYRGDHQPLKCWCSIWFGTGTCH